MNEKSKKIIREEMLNLPEDAQEAITTSGWEKKTEEIGRKYLLSDDEIITLQLETASFLLGFVDEDAYPRNIEDEVGASKDEANKIAEEVMQKIFIPINDALTENIKKSDKHKNANAEQNLDFILSGGDYSAFVEQKESFSPPPPEGLSLGSGPKLRSVVGEGLSTPQEGDISAKPKKMDDLRSKFTI